VSLREFLDVLIPGVFGFRFTGTRSLKSFKNSRSVKVLEQPPLASLSTPVKGVELWVAG
jgi:hypothetical protein